MPTIVKLWIAVGAMAGLLVGLVAGAVAGWWARGRGIAGGRYDAR